MAHIPTTERKYYNTEKKLNTLAAYSSAMLPAAQNLQQVIAQQEEIKMDSYALEARMEMNEITNNWRVQNENNPTDPTALKDLQSQYDDVLGKYREQVDPLYRYNWDIAGNKLKGAFDLQNQEWGFAQKQKNARANIARSVDNYIKLAYQYGQEDSEAEAMADFAQSYQKLLDYGAKNLGTEDAANMLKNYQSKFYESYLDGMIENNPDGALKLLNNKETYGILSKRDYARYKNYAHARQKQIKAEEYDNAYGSFIENPTQEGLDNLFKLKPDMKQKTKDELTEIYENSPDYEAKTVFSGATEAKSAAEEYLNITEGTGEYNEVVLEDLTSFVMKLKRSNAAKKLSDEDVNNFTNIAYKAVNDKVFAKQANGVFRDAGVFTKLVSVVAPERNKDKIEQIGGQTISAVVRSLAKGNVDDARAIYQNGQRQAIQVRYPDIDFSKLKVGDVIWYAPTKQAIKFLGYSYDDILVEVDPNTGAVK